MSADQSALAQLQASGTATQGQISAAQSALASARTKLSADQAQLAAAQQAIVSAQTALAARTNKPLNASVIAQLNAMLGL